MMDRLRALLQSAGMRHALVMSAATFLAGGLDYLFQIYTGRMLTPAEYSVFIAVTAL
jgi:O-antigen/teichoic acid export membrane protein